jgi:hypothetical protein
MWHYQINTVSDDPWGYLFNIELVYPLDLGPLPYEAGGGLRLYSVGLSSGPLSRCMPPA